MSERRIEPGGCAPAVYVGQTPPLRWYLKRARAGIALVCERVDDQRGYQVIVHDRRQAREWLPDLRLHVLAIDAMTVLPVKALSAEVADV